MTFDKDMKTSENTLRVTGSAHELILSLSFAGEDDDSSKEDEEELDKKMGDLGEGPTDTLDERMWGDDEDDEEEEGSDKEEESGQGMDQVQTTQWLQGL